MKKSKQEIGLKYSGEFSYRDRKKIVEEYLQTGCKKVDIWEKYTGQKEEKGNILRWMRQMGYVIPKKWNKLAPKNSEIMTNTNKQYSDENLGLKEKIKELEKALINSELHSTMYQTIIEIAEKELNINIKKKSNTKQSIK